MRLTSTLFLAVGWAFQLPARRTVRGPAAAKFVRVEIDWKVHSIRYNISPPPPRKNVTPGCLPDAQGGHIRERRRRARSGQAGRLYIYIYLRICVYMRVNVCACGYICVNLCICVYMRVYRVYRVYACVCAYICVYARICTYECVCARARLGSLGKIV